MQTMCILKSWVSKQQVCVNMAKLTFKMYYLIARKITVIIIKILKKKQRQRCDSWYICTTLLTNKDPPSKEGGRGPERRTQTMPPVCRITQSGVTVEGFSSDL